LALRPEFVGRSAELAAVDDCLDAAARGQPSVVLCWGEAGIGKTRLSEEALQRAVARGVLGARGVAVDTLGAPPYWPWRQVLRSLSERLDIRAVADEHRLRRDLSALAPEVFAGSDDAVAGGASAEDRFRQFDAFTRLLRMVCADRPAFVVLDDAHWADGASLRLLGHVVKGLTDEPLVLWVNSRDDEPSAERLVESWVRWPHVRQLHLTGLSEQAVSQQLESLTGHEVVPTVAAEVLALTGGNPFFVGEVARSLRDRRATSQPPRITPGVRETVRTRFVRLSERCVDALSAAAIAGQEFDGWLVAAMVEGSSTDHLGALAEAGRAGMVEPTGARGKYRFVHALVRDAIEGDLEPGERVRLHGLAAQAIEARHAGRLGAHIFDLARHWAEAAEGTSGSAAPAAHWLERAGDLAMAQLAYEDAARHYRDALRIGARELDDGDRCRVLLAAGRAMNRSADLGGRLEVCMEAAAIARGHGWLDVMGETALVMEPVGDTGSTWPRVTCARK